MRNLIALVFLSVIANGCDDAVSTKERPPAKYEEKKASLEEIERDSPLKFLKISGSTHSNLLKQTVVEGEIFNRATITSYKNVQVQITFHDKEGSVIEKQKEILNDVVKPGTSEDFKIKAGHVKGATSVTFDIVGATADK